MTAYHDVFLFELRAEDLDRRQEVGHDVRQGDVRALQNFLSEVWQPYLRTVGIVIDLAAGVHVRERRDLSSASQT